MSKKRREILRQTTREEIKSLAWEQIAANGAANLSLRKIAQAMEITPPALYRYFPSRDDLVTELIVEAYDSLAERLQNSWQTSTGLSSRNRMLQIAAAYRDWALRYPQRYSMIFGTPITGYHAPQEITMPAARGSLSGLMNCFFEAYAQNAFELSEAAKQLPSGVDDRLARLLEDAQLDAPAGVPYLALITWAKVHGLVSLEIYGHWDELIGDASAFYVHTIEDFLDHIGFHHQDRS